MSTSHCIKPAINVTSATEVLIFSQLKKRFCFNIIVTFNEQKNNLTYESYESNLAVLHLCHFFCNRMYTHSCATFIALDNPPFLGSTALASQRILTLPFFFWADDVPHSNAPFNPPAIHQQAEELSVSNVSARKSNLLAVCVIKCTWFEPHTSGCKWSLRPPSEWTMHSCGPYGEPRILYLL